MKKIVIIETRASVDIPFIDRTVNSSEYFAIADSLPRQQFTQFSPDGLQKTVTVTCSDSVFAQQQQMSIVFKPVLDLLASYRAARGITQTISVESI